MTFSCRADGHWVCCPRNALRRTLRLAQEHHGVAFRVGFETEFVLLDKYAATCKLDNLASAAVDNSLYCQSSALEDSAGGGSCQMAHGPIKALQTGSCCHTTQKQYHIFMQRCDTVHSQ